jgi:hypothetical protein
LKDQQIATRELSKNLISFLLIPAKRLFLFVFLLDPCEAPLSHARIAREKKNQKQRASSSLLFSSTMDEHGQPLSKKQRKMLVSSSSIPPSYPNHKPKNHKTGKSKKEKKQRQNVPRTPANALEEIRNLRDQLLSSSDDSEGPTLILRAPTPSSASLHAPSSSFPLAPPNNGTTQLSPQEQAQEILRKRKELKRLEELKKQADQLKAKIKLLESVRPSVGLFYRR